VALLALLDSPKLDAQTVSSLSLMTSWKQHSRRITQWQEQAKESKRALVKSRASMHYAAFPTASVAVEVQVPLDTFIQSRILK
jgi:hypothetical protein